MAQHGHARAEGNPERGAARSFEVGVAELLPPTAHQVEHLVLGKALEEDDELLPSSREPARVSSATCWRAIPLT